MLHPRCKLTSPQGAFIDGFADEGIFVPLCFRDNFHRSFSLFGHGVGTSIITTEVSTHHIEIEMLSVLHVQLIIDIQRRNDGLGLLSVFHFINLILLIEERISIRKGMRNIFRIVTESDVQHTFLPIRIIVVERCGDVIIFDTIGRCHHFTIGNDLMRIIKRFFILPIPFQIPTAPLHQSRESRFTLMILTRQLIVTEAKGRNTIGQVGRDITTRFFPLDNIVNDRRRSSITQARLLMVFHPDNILRSKSHDFLMGSLHSIDTKLNRFSIIGSNTFGHRIDGQSRQLKMLKKRHPIRRCFLLCLRRHHQLAVYLLNHLLAFHHHFVQ